MAASPNKQHIAVGYHNGTVKIVDIKSGDEVVTFSGHKTAITSLTFDEKGMLLASGSRVSMSFLVSSIIYNAVYDGRTQ